MSVYSQNNRLMANLIDEQFKAVDERLLFLASLADAKFKERTISDEDLIMLQELIERLPKLPQLEEEEGT